ncbi:MAG: DNA repair and recombination protein RadA [Candidatus Heimdallarchaeota archaeon]
MTDVGEEKTVQALTDLPGVGPTTAKKLEEAGFSTLEALAIASIGELVAAADIGEKTASKIIESARGSLDLSFETADLIYERRKAITRLTTGSTTLDELFGGGVETNGILELFGEFRTGKTQIAHQLCVSVQMPKNEGGFEAGAIYIDTEGTFRPERIVQMAERFGLDYNEILKNIEVGRAYNSDHQMVLVDQFTDRTKDKNIRLLVVDSLTSHFRAEYVGRGTLAERQQKLNKHMHTLLRLAEINNICVLVTNQVMAKPDQFFGDPTAPIGGHIVAHACTTRVYLRKSKGNRRIARVVDSPWLPESEAVFAITEKGIEDA